MRVGNLGGQCENLSYKYPLSNGSSIDKLTFYITMLRIKSQKKRLWHSLCLP